MATYPGKIIEVSIIHAVRNPQVKTGFFVNPENDKGGSDPIQTPRKAPLEVSWKRANANVFE